MKRQAVGTTALLAVAGLAAQGCTETQVEGGAKPEVGSQVQELIGGVPGNSPALDAIGTIGFLSTYTDCYTGEVSTYYEPFCTASLINSQTVLTAKHCEDNLAYASENFEAVFAIGPDASNPKRTIKIVDSQKNPVHNGGFVGYGRDVATVHLEQAVTDIKPLKFETMSAAQVGTELAAVGYGVQDNSNTSGTRMIGTLRVNALEGKVYELMFGSFENFKQWYLTRDAPEPELPADDEEEPVDDGTDDGSVDDGSDDDYYDEYLREIYDTTLLLPGYEVHVGNAAGDAQPCYGDSGGPLVKINGNGDLVAYGVTSGGLGTNDLICDRGAVYAAFGAQTTSWLKRANKWADSCAGLSAQGICDGDVAKRCTTSDEGKRRMTKTNCALLGQTCVVASNDQAMCVTAGEEPVVISVDPPSECPWWGEDPVSGDGDGDGDGDDDGDGDGESLRERLEAVQAQNQSIFRGPLGEEP
jgi:hypothetical protein